MLDLQFPGDIGQPAGPARPDIFFRAAEVFEGLVGERLVVDRHSVSRAITSSYVTRGWSFSRSRLALVFSPTRTKDAADIYRS